MIIILLILPICPLIYKFPHFSSSSKVIFIFNEQLEQSNTSSPSNSFEPITNIPPHLHFFQNKSSSSFHSKSSTFTLRYEILIFLRDNMSQMSFYTQELTNKIRKHSSVQIFKPPQIHDFSPSIFLSATLRHI